MGCVYSTKERRRPAAVSFTVEFRMFHRHFPHLEHYNGNELCYGILTIQEDEMILRKTNTFHSIAWPLNTIRRYGFREDMFCFEVGRLSLTGQGLFALKCENARLVFQTFKITLKEYNEKRSGKEKLPELRNPYSNMFEAMYNDVRSRSSNNNSESPYAMLEADSKDLHQGSFVNVFDDDDDNDDFFNKPSTSKSCETLTYTEVEIAETAINPRPVIPAEKSVYTSIDFLLTMQLSQKMFRCTDNSGTRKTRHDFIVEDFEP